MKETNEMKICPVCGHKYYVGFLDKELRKKIKRETIIGIQNCPDCEEKSKDYIALIVVDPKKCKMTGDILKNENAYRTGEIVWMKRERFELMFKEPIETLFVFIDDKLRNMLENEANK